MASDSSYGAQSRITAGGYAVELPITFESGAGVTSAVSLQRVRFRTGIRLKAGDRLVGSMHLSRGKPSLGILRYEARVLHVEPVRRTMKFEVDASFERIELTSS
jgi:hypothetical protein